jgi:hypothetical protein
MATSASSTVVGAGSNSHSAVESGRPEKGTSSGRDALRSTVGAGSAAMLFSKAKQSTTRCREKGIGHECLSYKERDKAAQLRWSSSRYRAVVGSGFSRDALRSTVGAGSAAMLFAPLWQRLQPRCSSLHCGSGSSRDALRPTVGAASAVMLFAPLWQRLQPRCSSLHCGSGFSRDALRSTVGAASAAMLFAPLWERLQPRCFSPRQRNHPGAAEKKSSGMNALPKRFKSKIFSLDGNLQFPLTVSPLTVSSVAFAPSGARP